MTDALRLMSPGLFRRRQDTDGVGDDAAHQLPAGCSRSLSLHAQQDVAADPSLAYLVAWLAYGVAARVHVTSCSSEDAKEGRP